MLKVDLKKEYQNFKLDLKFELDKEILVLFGPSGCGKTTTLELIAGLKQPDSGQIISDDVEFFNSTGGKIEKNLAVMQRDIGYVFQSYSLFPHLTVFDNIAYGLRKSEHSDAKIKEMVKNMLVELRLEGLSDNYPAELSGGQQQRVAIARALIIKPKILLMDEPFSALDALVREKLRQDLLRVHQEYQIPLIYVTHNSTDVFVLADKVAVYNRGRIEQFGSTDEVFYKPQTRDVARFVGAKNIFDLMVEEKLANKFKLKNKNLSLFVENKEELSLREKVVAVIRPEFITVLTDESKEVSVSDNIYSGFLEKKLVKGSITRLFVNLFSQEGFDILIDTLTTKVEDLEPGSELKFKIPATRVHLIKNLGSESNLEKKSGK